MIDNRLHEKLVGVLYRVPIIQNPIGLKGLIATIPNSVNIYPDSGNILADLDILVNHLACYRSLQGEWFLLIFIDKVISRLRGTSLVDELAEIRSQLEALLPPRIQAAHNAIEPYSFDLEHLTTQCLGILPTKPTLAGYIIPLCDDRFLRYFCQRLKYEWIEGHTQVVTKSNWTIHPTHTSVQHVVQKICSLQTQLQKNTIIVGILVREAVDAKDFWLSLQENVMDRQQNHLIIIMAVPQILDPIPGVTVLDRPVFSKQHVWTWVRNLAEKRQWPTDGMKRWVDIIVEECQLGGSLEPEHIYQYLEYDARDLLEKNVTYEAFCTALQTL